MPLFGALPLYDFPEVRALTDQLFGSVSARLREEGVDVSSTPSRHPWPYQDSRFCYGQVCARPLVTELHSWLTPVLSPVFRIDGLSPGSYRSALVVARSSPVETHAELPAEARVAVNEFGSHSGWSVLVATLGPVARERIRLTGSHAASIAAVTAGEAMVAAVDEVSWTLLRRWRPSACEGVRVLSLTGPAPAPPYVVRAQDHAEPLRRALQASFADPANANALDGLALQGLTSVPDLTSIGELAAQAPARGTRSSRAP